MENNLGARGLCGIMEDLMTKAMFNLPSEDTKSFNVTLKYAKKILENIEYKED
jgi:ATP-dependent protease Clp ATPase subunit